MKFMIVALFAFVAYAQAGVLVAPSANILQGPSSRTTVVGPDGSSISAVAPGGQIVTQENLGVVAHSAPLVAHSVPVLAYSAPLLHGGVDTIVSGPSGVIATNRGFGLHGGLLI